MKTHAFLSILILTVIALVASCATSSGDAFAEVVRAETDAGEGVSDGGDEEAPAEEVEEEEDVEDAGLTVFSRPRGAAVYIDGTYEGTTPLELDEIEPGVYLVSIRAPGYEDYDRSFEVTEGTSHELTVRLTPRTGFLFVDLPKGEGDGEDDSTYVYVDGRQVDEEVVEVLIGDRTVRVERFGFETVEEEVEVEEDRVTRFAPELEPAEFEFRSISRSRPAFHPQNVGVAGRVEFRFAVSAPGQGRIAVLDEDGAVVSEREYPEFTRIYYTYVWDGKNQEGEIVEDGEYTARLEGFGADGFTVSSLEAVVRVDSSYRLRARSTWSGLPGLLYTPLPDSLPTSAFSVGTLFVAHIEDVDGTTTVRVPLVTSVRLGLGEGFQLALSGSAVVNTMADRSATFATLGATWQYLGANQANPVVEAAVGLKATAFSPLATDSLTNFDGVALTLPFAVRLGPVGIAIAPEFLLSPERISYAAGSGSPVMESPSLWGYGRAGLYLDLPGFVLGASAAVRTTPVEEGFVPTFPVLLGLETHLLAGDGTTVLSLPVTAEVFGDGDFFVSVGLGFGVLF